MRSAVLPARAVCSSWRRRRFGQARGGRSSSPTRTARPTRRPTSISYWRPDRKTGCFFFSRVFFTRTGISTSLENARRDDIDFALLTGARPDRAPDDSCSRRWPDGDICRRAKSRCRQVAAELFADGCATCHRSPRGLAKGRFNLTLSWFLEGHYTTSSDTAKALAAYLESVDAAPPRAAALPVNAVVT